MEAQFELHRTDERLFDEGEGGRIFAEAVAQTRYPMSLKEITQANGAVAGTIRVVGEHQYYRIQLLLAQLQKIPGISIRYRGGD